MDASITIFKKLQQGMSPLRTEEKMRLIERYQTKQEVEIANILLLQYLWFIVKVVRKFRVERLTALDNEDLIYPGIVGFKRAVYKYIPDGGVAFTTWASWYMRGDILRYIYDNRYTVRRPYRRKNAKLSPPTDLRYHEQISTGDNKSEQGENQSIVVIPDKAAETAYKRIVLKQLVGTLLECLNTREQKIIRMYYWDDMTLEEIGTHFNEMTKQNIRVIVTHALHKMKRKYNREVALPEERIS